MLRLKSIFGAAAVLLLGAAAPVPPSTPAGAATEYRLAPDDRVKVVVYGEEDLTGEYLVGGDGSISFPLVGPLDVRGLTLGEFRKALAQRLRQSLKDPKVSADIVAYRPFYILGEVNKAGQYPFRIGMTVNAAVATAGGFTYRANHKMVGVQHAGEATEHRERITPDLQIIAGDTIRVLERFF